jgi:hypothetical protein
MTSPSVRATAASGPPDNEDVEIVRAEGLALGPERRDAAVRFALASVPSAVASFATRCSVSEDRFYGLQAAPEPGASGARQYHLLQLPPHNPS